MLKSLMILYAASTVTSTVAMAQAKVHVEAVSLEALRPLQQQTADSAIHDYLQSWQSLQSALDQNRAELLEPDFVGDAKGKLGTAIENQSALGLRTRYHDDSHQLHLVFYSPEGLSIELTDDVEYDLEILDHDKSEVKHHLHARYIAVLTPSDSRWRVRVLQAVPE